MRILLSVDPEIPVPPRLYGGIERIVNQMIVGFAQHGHQVGLVAHPESTAPAHAFFPWPGGRSQNRSDTIRNTRVLYQTIREFQPEVLHSFSRLLYMAPIMFSRLPKIMSFQRHPNARTVKWAARLAGKSLTFTGCSEYICRRGRAAGGNWVPIHNFVDLETYTFQPEVPADAPLVFLSRVERIKGAHSAIATALKTGRRLIIAGNHAADGEELIYWKELIEPFLGKNGIEYVGPVDDRQKNELLGKAAAMIVPIEWHEPFGIVFAEALACGTPVISCPMGALPEIVTEGKTGFLCSSAQELCAAVETLPQLDRTACRQRAETHFSTPVIVGQYLRLYESLLNVV